MLLRQVGATTSWRGNDGMLSLTCILADLGYMMGFRSHDLGNGSVGEEAVSAAAGCLCPEPEEEDLLGNIRADGAGPLRHWLRCLY